MPVFALPWNKKKDKGADRGPESNGLRRENTAVQGPRPTKEESRGPKEELERPAVADGATRDDARVGTSSNAASKGPAKADSTPARKPSTAEPKLPEAAPSPELEYLQVVGKGSFGTVTKARLRQTDEIVAVKTVLQDRRFKNRELEILVMLAEEDHPNLPRLRKHFTTEKDKEVLLHLVLEYVPVDLSRLTVHYFKRTQKFPLLDMKLYMVQVANGLAFLHSKGVCHRDLKPSNILVDRQTRRAQICDMGSAKYLEKGKPNIAYISSRWYRAPELILGSEYYSFAIDVWSYGCILGELLLGAELFKGENSIDQMSEIISILGYPSPPELTAMNDQLDLAEYAQSSSNHVSLRQILESIAPEHYIDLIEAIILYSPDRRLRAMDIIRHSFFSDLATIEMVRELFGANPPWTRTGTTPVS